MRTVTSRQNPVVRAFRTLADAADPDGVRLLLDGLHLLRAARDAALPFEVAAIAASRLVLDGEERTLASQLDREGVDVLEVPDRLFRALSPVRTPSGVVAIVRRTPPRAEEICGRRDGFVLVVAGVQDPGNVGSLLRAAEAGGVTGAVCANTANPFSWKALRGSMGSAVRLPVAMRQTPQAAFDDLRAAGVRTIAAVPRQGQDPDALNWSGRIGLVLGGEGSGLPDDLAARCDERVTIPMAPEVESLNVAVAGAILIYAARRQRLAPAHR
jgi:TrmH family RNA methyltransferase